MLKSKLIHPQLLEAIGRAGHGAKILIADGNYPAGPRLGRNAKLVHLNLMPGVVSCTQALEAVVSASPVEAAVVMQYAKTGPYALTQDPPIWAEFRGILKGEGFKGDLQPVERFAFYEQGEAPDVAVTIQTGDQRIYANLLLTIGVVM
ncbi:MAG: transporter [Phycisphaeraceae bacterium]|nr:transporter [Phycisphaeraceae bacterium]